ncbi:hypothetical protein B296_00045219 [Ensete ventricosum]|uniref:Uncharacterized protein n=1 Tax=Ensete ventricosum TaxID=4639 RepID=A0A426YD97_ENSVE|nr:hypothetical protein B296_00045219 [Ensete ventricosum]
MEGTRLYKGMIGAAGELDYFSAYIYLREPGKSEDKVEGGSIDREGRDADARQPIVGPWDWQRHGIAEAVKVREKTVQSQRRPELSKTYSKLGDSKLG